MNIHEEFKNQIDKSTLTHLKVIEEKQCLQKFLDHIKPLNLEWDQLLMIGIQLQELVKEYLKNLPKEVKTELKE